MLPIVSKLLEFARVFCRFRKISLIEELLDNLSKRLESLNAIQNIKLRKLFTGYTMFPLILITGIGIFCFVILSIGRFTNDFSAKEGSLRYELGMALWFYGICLSSFLVLVNFIYIGLCLSRMKPLAVWLTLAACLLLYFGVRYANYCYIHMNY